MTFSPLADSEGPEPPWPAAYPSCAPLLHSLLQTSETSHLTFISCSEEPARDIPWELPTQGHGWELKHKQAASSPPELCSVGALYNPSPPGTPTCPQYSQEITFPELESFPSLLTLPFSFLCLLVYLPSDPHLRIFF